MIQKLRNSELDFLRKCGIFYCSIDYSFGFTSFMVNLLILKLDFFFKFYFVSFKATFISFLTFIYVDENNKLEPGIVYVSISFFQLIRLPLFLLAPSFSAFVQVIIPQNLYY